MSNQEDKIAVGIGVDGAKIEAAGQGAERISNALADLISPLTEGAGALGDRIRYYRQRAALEALQRAHEIAQERGVKFKAVPPKFLIRWLESASLEDEETSLKELWAELLVSASIDYDVETIKFAEILSSIGHREALIIRHIADRGELATWQDRRKRATAAAAFEFYDKPDDIKPQVLEAIERSDISIFENLRRYLPNGYPVIFASTQKGMATKSANKIDTIFENPFVAEHAPGFEILKQQGIIRSNYVGFGWGSSPSDGPSGIAWYEFTELGFRFVFRVCGFGQ